MPATPSTNEGTVSGQREGRQDRTQGQTTAEWHRISRIEVRRETSDLQCVAKPQQETSVRFDSAVDRWLLPALIVAPLLVAVPIGFVEGEPIGALLGGSGLGVLFAGLVAYFTRGTAYFISGRYLTIRSGGLETILDLAWIQDVKPILSMSPAPCRSIHRVRITYTHGQVDVSPRNRPSFMAELDHRRRRRGTNYSDLLK